MTYSVLNYMLLALCFRYINLDEIYNLSKFLNMCPSYRLIPPLVGIVINFKVIIKDVRLIKKSSICCYKFILSVDRILIEINVGPKKLHFTRNTKFGKDQSTNDFLLAKPVWLLQSTYEHLSKRTTSMSNTLLLECQELNECTMDI